MNSDYTKAGREFKPLSGDSLRITNFKQRGLSMPSPTRPHLRRDMVREARRSFVASAPRQTGSLAGLIEVFSTMPLREQRVIIKLLNALTLSSSPLRLTELAERSEEDKDFVSVKMGQLMKYGAVEAASDAYIGTRIGGDLLELLKGISPKEEVKKEPRRESLEEPKDIVPVATPNGRAVPIPRNSCPIFKPEILDNLKPADILCLDLDQYGIDGALRCVRGARLFEINNPDKIVPSIVLIGSTSGWKLSDAYYLNQRVTAAGAIFYERQPNKTFEQTVAHIDEVRNKIYANFHRHENGFYPKGSPQPSERQRENTSDTDPSVEPDFSVYEEFPVHLSEEDFQDLF